MNQHTVHLICNLIRHQRGIMTAIDKWVSKQAPCRTNLEISAATTLMREILDSYEAQIKRVEVVDEEEIVSR